MLCYELARTLTESLRRSLSLSLPLPYLLTARAISGKICMLMLTSLPTLVVVVVAYAQTMQCVLFSFSSAFAFDIGALHTIAAFANCCCCCYCYLFMVYFCNRFQRQAREKKEKENRIWNQNNVWFAPLCVSYFNIIGIAAAAAAATASVLLQPQSTSQFVPTAL